MWPPRPGAAPSPLPSTVGFAADGVPPPVPLEAEPGGWRGMELEGLEHVPVG